MAEEAADLINQAMKVDNHVPSVEERLADIIQRRELERDKETEILNQASDTRRFFVDLGRALSAPTPPLDGRWKFPFGIMPLSVVSGTVQGTTDVERKEGGLAVMLRGIGGPSEPTVRLETYVFTGELTGAACEFALTIGEKSEHGAAGVLLSNKPSRSGFIVFAEDGTSASYAEVSNSKLGKIEIIRKKKSA